MDSQRASTGVSASSWASARLRSFVEAGGTAVMTYWSAVVDESDLCFLGGIPGAGLREVFGVWEEESQSYFPNESVSIAMEKNNALEMDGLYTAVDTCSVIHAEGSEVLATYADDYLAGSPALTVNGFGTGKAYYMASRNEGRFLADFYGRLISSLAIERVVDADLPAGVTAQIRTDGQTSYTFLMNFNDRQETVELDATYTDLLTEQLAGGSVALEPYGVMILTKPRQTKQLDLESAYP